jgi:hypothetical protein
MPLSYLWMDGWKDGCRCKYALVLLEKFFFLFGCASLSLDMY